MGIQTKGDKAMKRRISILLCICLILSSVMLVNAEPSAAECEKERYILNRLGIAETETTDDLSVSVSRAKFAWIISKALRLGGSDERYFWDVDPNYWAAKSINALAEGGYISGSGGGAFEPDGLITYEQACKILVTAAGYKECAGMSAGDSMSGYIRTAQRIGIDVNPENSEALSLREVILMVYRTMSIPMVYETGVEDGRVKGEVTDKETLFSLYHNVYISDGRLCSVYGRSIDDTVVTQENKAVIDGEDYILDEGVGTDGLFGRNIDFVYIKSDSESLLIYAETNGKDKYTLIEGGLLKGFDSEDYTFTYYPAEESNSVKRVSAQRGASVILNGRSFGGRISDVADEFISEDRKGTIELISTGGGAADIIIINSYRTFTAGGYDSVNKIFFSYYDDAVPVSVKECETLRILDARRKSAEIPTAFPISLSIASSEDGLAAEIVICGEFVEGTITAADAEKREVTVDGKVYKADKTVYKNILAYLTVGKQGRFYTDAFGEIVFADSNTGDMQLGYLRGATGDGNVFGQKYTIDLYITDKKFHSYPIADRVNIDGVMYKAEDYKEMFDAIPGNTVYYDTRVCPQRQVIRFATNSKGEINKIDTYNPGAEDADSTLSRRMDGSRAVRYLPGAKRFDLADPYDGSTVYFIVPKVNEKGLIEVKGSTKQDDASMYGTSYNFQADHTYYMETYYINSVSYAACAMVMQREPAEADDTVFMFDCISDSLDADGNACKRINGYSGGAEISYILEDSAVNDAAKLKRGDLARVDGGINEGSAVAVVKMFDAETMTFMPYSDTQYTDPSRNWYYGDESNTYSWRAIYHQLTKTYAYAINGDFYQGCYGIGNAAAGIINETSNISALSITVYDKELDRENIYSGTAADIIGYKLSRDDCSVVITNNSAVTLKQMFVYK